MIFFFLVMWFGQQVFMSPKAKHLANSKFLILKKTLFTEGRGVGGGWQTLGGISAMSRLPFVDVTLSPGQQRIDARRNQNSAYSTFPSSTFSIRPGNCAASLPLHQRYQTACVAFHYLHRHPHRFRMQRPLKRNIFSLHFSHPSRATVHIQKFPGCKTLLSRPYWLLKVSEARARENLRVHLSPVPIGGGVEVHTARRAPLLSPIPFWICPFWRNVSITYNSAALRPYLLKNKTQQGLNDCNTLRIWKMMSLARPRNNGRLTRLDPTPPARSVTRQEIKLYLPPCNLFFPSAAKWSYCLCLKCGLLWGKQNKKRVRGLKRRDPFWRKMKQAGESGPWLSDTAAHQSPRLLLGDSSSTN